VPIVKETDKAFSGLVPDLYERYLGPWMFESYATDLARRAAEREAERVLETAAGTGIATRALVRAFPANVSITATDLNQGMLDVAARLCAAPNVTWRQADALALPFADRAFDVAVCQFGAMFFPDKLAAYRETLRVLRPGGRFLFNVWDRIEENEFAHTISDAVAACFPDDPPQFLRRTPWGYHDVAAIREGILKAGFRQCAAETVSVRARAPSARVPAVGICQGSPLRLEIEARGTGALETATAAATAALERRFGTGPIEGKMQALVFTAAS
jgi:ubiquinone/menaquinone biosynthesis C-methylase UbiE